MIRVEKADLPPDFDELVGNPGQIVLWELSGDPRAPVRSGPKRKHLAPLWTDLLPYMRKAYRRRCAYLAQRVPKGTGCDSVDHFKCKDDHRELAYTWDNYRYASLNVNREKGTKVVLDPFEVQEDWFGLDLESFKVYARPALNSAALDIVRSTLDVLNASSFCEARGWYVSRYFGIQLEEDDPEEPMALSQLRHEAPFVAAELARQRKLLPKDQGSVAGEEYLMELENPHA